MTAGLSMIERTFITIGPTHYVEDDKYSAPGGFPPRARHRAASHGVGGTVRKRPDGNPRLRSALGFHLPGRGGPVRATDGSTGEIVMRGL